MLFCNLNLEANLTFSLLIAGYNVTDQITLWHSDHDGLLDRESVDW